MLSDASGSASLALSGEGGPLPQGPVRPQGATGAQSPTGGQQGPAGAQGVAGPKGVAGRDALVTGKVGKTKNRKITVTCRVKSTAGLARAARASWQLARGGRTVAHGVAYLHSGRIAIDLAHTRGVRPGRYRPTQ